MSSSALMPVGTVRAGPLAVALGIRTTLLGMSALGIAAALAYLAVPPVRSLRRRDHEWAIAETAHEG